MSLKLWFPLTKDTLNYGASFSNVTATNVAANTNGKIGGCYSFTGSSSYLLGTHDFITNNLGDFSFACWMKLNSTATGQTLFSCRASTNSAGITVFYYGSRWLFDDGTRWEFTPTKTIAANTWYHVCFVRKKGVAKYLYINGVLDSSTTTLGTLSNVSTTHFTVGGSQNTSTTANTNWLNGYLNDLRFYDYALSIAEIHELSKGLLRNYKLDEFASTDNLIVNGFGELGTENWTSTSTSYISTTEIPPNHPEIKASFYNGNMTSAYIPISKNHIYTLTGYIKAMSSGGTSNTYPSIYPYDYDKKMIQYFHSKGGFDTATTTTLSQPLRNGDTVIHATNLSKWRVDTTSYYFHVAIFGYKNSAGYMYDDLIYTQDCPKFGSRTDKSNIDKTNNTITLLAAYTGGDRPAGTTICQATEGSTYFYPWGGINPTSIADWTFKTGNFSTKDSRLLACEYIRWSTYGRCYIAGNKLVDNFLHTNQTIDSSGYGYHGTRHGNLTTSYKSARHDICAVFDGTSAYIESDPLPLETKTISVWIKTSWVSSSSYQLAVHDKQTGLAIGWASAQLITYVGTSNGGSGSRIVITNTNYTANQWNHIVVVKTGATTRNVYVNGVLATPESTNYWGGDLMKLNIGVRHISGAYSAYFNGQLSDFRAYATELSAADVLALYNVGASVANTGSIISYQMKEG